MARGVIRPRRSDQGRDVIIETKGTEEVVPAPATAARGRPSRRSAGWTSTWPRARSSASSGRTGRARPRHCACSPRSSSPTAGEATVAGVDLRRQPGRGAPAHRVRRAGRQHLGRVDRPRGARAARADVRAEQGRGAMPRAERALAAFQLTEYADRRCKTYSGGQRRRVDIALGIIHRAEGRLPGRTDHRARPAEPGPHVGRDPPAARRGHDRVHHHALPGRGRRALRPGRHHRPRPDRRRGHAGRAQARGLRRRGHRRPQRRHGRRRQGARLAGLRQQAGDAGLRRAAPLRRRGRRPPSR